MGANAKTEAKAEGKAKPEAKPKPEVKGKKARSSDSRTEKEAKEAKEAKTWWYEQGHSHARCYEADGCSRCNYLHRPLYVNEVAFNNAIPEHWLQRDGLAVDFLAVSCRSGADVMFRDLPTSAYGYMGEPRGGQRSQISLRDRQHFSISFLIP